MKNKTLWMFAALLLSAQAFAGFWGGAATEDHGHTGPGDGGALTNPTISGGTINNTAVNASTLTARGEVLVGGTNSGHGCLGIGLAGGDCGQMIHTFGGNWFTDASGEVGWEMRRTALANSPIFTFGRIITAGDGSPEFRVNYQDDVIADRTVFEFDNKGIIASVKPIGANGSFYEGFVSGDVQPYFRINGAAGGVQFEMGPGGTTNTDWTLQRTGTSLATVTGGMLWTATAASGYGGVTNGKNSAQSISATEANVTYNVSSGTGAGFTFNGTTVTFNTAGNYAITYSITQHCTSDTLGGGTFVFYRNALTSPIQEADISFPTSVSDVYGSTTLRWEGSASVGQSYWLTAKISGTCGGSELPQFGRSGSGSVNFISIRQIP